jgi:hypothetical protein
MQVERGARSSAPTLGLLIAAAMTLGTLGRAHADDASPPRFDDVKWQSAGPADMALFAPYIGTFRGSTRKADDGTEFYFTVAYDWFDQARTVVKFSLEIHIPSRDQVRSLGEAFYYYEPSLKRLAVAGFFRDGRTGSGFVTPFDTTTHERVVRVRSRQPDGSQVDVRDTFWVIDADSWGNRTFVATDDGWQVVSDEIFNRVAD